MYTKFVTAARVAMAVVFACALGACAGPDNAQQDFDPECCDPVHAADPLSNCDTNPDVYCDASPYPVPIAIMLTNYTSRYVTATVSIAQTGGTKTLCSGAPVSSGATWTASTTSLEGDVVTYDVLVFDGSNTRTSYQYTVNSNSTSCTFSYKDICLYGPNQPTCTYVGSEIRGNCN